MSDPPADLTRTQSAPAPTVSATVVAIGVPVPGEDDSPLRASAHAGDLGRLGRYRVLKRLGAGGMGEVYLAFDDGLRRRLALKVMLPKYAAHPAARSRFLREARTAASVRSPHVVAIHDVDEDNGVPFIAMEYLEGTPLDEYLKQSPGLSVPQMVRIGREAAAGLAAAHAAGLVHRDVKPANLWLQAPHGRVKLLDFGLAREEANDETQVTGTGDVVGTPAYMSPEQARGERVDARTDLFSLGVLLYRLAAGRLPFTGPTAMAVLTSLAMDDPAPVRSHNPAVPAALAALIHRLLAKRPDDRPRSSDEVCAALAALDGALTPGVPAAPIAVAVQEEDVWDGIDAAPTEDAAPGAHVAKKRRGFPWLAVGGSVVAVLAAGLLAVVALNHKPAPPDLSPAPATGRPDSTRSPEPKGDSERRAAGVLHPHCILRLRFASGRETDLHPTEALPAEPFKVKDVIVGRDTPLDRDTFFAAVGELRDLKRLNDLYNLLALTDADLARFATMPLAETLAALNVPGVELTPAVATALARFKQLSHLNVKAETADDAVLKRLAREQSGLRNLILVGLGQSGQVTAAGIAALTGMPLTHLTLTGSLKLTREWAALLAGRPTLQALTLHVGYADDAVLAEFAACKVSSFTCNGPYTKVTNDGMKHVARMPGVQSLDVDSLSIDDAGLEHLAALKNLKNLVVLRTNVTAAGVLKFKAAVPACTIRTTAYDPKADPDRVAAEWVLGKGGNVVLVGPVPVTALADLPPGPLCATEVHLVINNYRLTDADLDRFAPLARLTVLRTGRCDVTDSGLEKLSRSPAAKTLQSLYLPALKITDDGLKCLSSFPALSKLYLSYAAVSGTGFAVLHDLKHLTHLFVGETRVNNEGLRHLSGLEALECLHLNLTKVTDAGIKGFDNLPQLRLLELSGNDVSDETLKYLADAKGFPKLTALNVSDTKVTDAGISAFAKARPTCKVTK